MQPRCPLGSQHLIRFSVGHFALSQGTRGRYRMRLLRFLLQCSGAFFGYRGLSLLNCCEQGKARFPRTGPSQNARSRFRINCEDQRGFADRPPTLDIRQERA